MRTRFTPRRPRATLLTAALLLSASGMALAAVSSAVPSAERSQIETQYQHDRVACVNGATSNQDRATCLKEAGAVRAEGLRGLDLDSGSSDYQRNQLERCKVFIDRADARECRMRVQQGAVSGSVRDGGILRERTTIVPAPASPPPTP